MSHALDHPANRISHVSGRLHFHVVPRGNDDLLAVGGKLRQLCLALLTFPLQLSRGNILAVVVSALGASQHDEGKLPVLRSAAWQGISRNTRRTTRAGCSPHRRSPAWPAPKAA